MQRLVVVTRQSTGLLKAVELNGTNPGQAITFLTMNAGQRRSSFFARADKVGHRIYRDSNITAVEALSTFQVSTERLSGLRQARI
jgi:hypothetical protein